MSTKVSTDLIDLSSNTGGLVWAKGTTAQQPASATAGEMRVDTTTATTLVYNGTQWKTLKETAFVVPPVPTHFLVVAGGGGGAKSANGTGSGAGGAGGLRTSYGSTSGGNSSAESNIEISLNTPYNITVGNGGAGTTTATNGNQGSSSTFSTITSIGGGGGFMQRSGSASTVNGGSGGGGEGFTNSAGGSGTNGFGTGTADQGKDGGVGSNSASAYGGGGGGGAITVGGGGSSTSGGSGGTGLESSITGTATFFAGGGGGGSSTATGGTGGSGIGGNGGSSVTGSFQGENGVFNTGSGGGGGGNSQGFGGSGGPGVVILRYPTADLPYFTTTGTLNTPSATDTVADVAYPVTNLAYYKLDSNANDSGLGSGYIGQGGIFNGTSSVISLGTSSPLNTFGGAQTISVWVKPSSADRESIIGYRQEASPYQWNQIEKMSNNTLRFLLGNYSDSSQFVFTSVGTITSNQWNHIAITVDSTSAKIYINNGTAETQTGTPTSYSNSEPTFIGGDGTYDTDYFTGTIDQVRIYNTALSSSNVALLYAETSATSSTLNYPTGTGGQALYEFSGNADSTSSSAYNGTATNVLYAYNGTATNVTYENGRFNEAGNFNGSSSLISLPTGVDRNNNFTLSFWVNFDTLSDYDSLITLQLNYRIYTNAMSDGRLFFYDGNTTLSTSAGVVATGNWYNIVVTKSSTLVNGKGMIIYVNGVDVANNSVTANAINNASAGLNLLGAYNSSPGGNYFYLDGNVDQVRIFSSALAPGDIEDLYNEHFQTKFTDGSDTALKFTGGTGDITFADTAPVFTPGDNFNTVLYSGNSSTQSITGVGFQPDFTWIKRRDGTENHYLQDSVRGSTQQIYTNITNSQFNETTAVTSFSANGFNMGSYNGINNSGETYVAWSWKAGGAARNNTDGSIASLVSANVDAGFSIVQYTGTGSLATVGHGLNQPVELILVKNTSASASWAVYSAPTGINKFLELNSAGAAISYSNYWGAATPTNDVFGVVNGNFNNNATNASLIAYCFHSVSEYSKIGSYTGSGTTLQTITTGFEPAFIMFKNTDAGNVWTIMDNKRNTTNPRNLGLFPDLSNSEYTYPGTPNGLSFTSTGFTLNTGQAEFNQNNLEYIYMAFATNPT